MELRGIYEVERKTDGSGGSQRDIDVDIRDGGSADHAEHRYGRSERNDVFGVERIEEGVRS